MASRDLVTPRQREALADVMSTCFIAELLAPSDPLWLISAWISDVELIENSGGAFEALAPDWPKGPVKLSAILQRLLELGGHVFVAMMDNQHNDAFILRLKAMQQQPFGQQLRFAVSPQLHQKCMCGERFAIRGSMNFTRNGLNAKEEQMTVTLDSAEVQKLRFELHDRWEAAVPRNRPT